MYCDPLAGPIANMINTSFIISTMTKYMVTVSDSLVSFGNVYKVSYHLHYFLTLIVTGCVQQLTSLIL